MLPTSVPLILRKFCADDQGAVTTDWVVLTAAIVGLGIGAAAVVRTGTSALGGDIQTSLSGSTVASLDCMGTNDGPAGFECYDGPTITSIGMASAWVSDGYCVMDLDGGGYCTPGSSGSTQSYQMSDGSTYYQNITTSGSERTETWTDGRGNPVDEPPPAGDNVTYQGGCWQDSDGYTVCA